MDVVSSSDSEDEIDMSCAFLDGYDTVFDGENDKTPCPLDLSPRVPHFLKAEMPETNDDGSFSFEAAIPESRSKLR